MSAYVREIIRQKREWHHKTTPEELARGFRGWHSRGYLPHFDRPGGRQMITYRLADSMPASRRNEWMALLAIEDERQKRIEIENYLDRGFGECQLRTPEIAAIVQENLLYSDSRSYRLLAWAIMPNHVHALIEVLDVPLALIVRNWKTYTSRHANALLDRSGRFWQPDYFDRYIRDAEHFRKALRYIENNPVKAKLVREPHQWPWSSASHRHQTSDRSADSLSARAASADTHTRGQTVRAPMQTA